MSSLTVPIPPDLSPACRAGNTDLGTVPIAYVPESTQLVVEYELPTMRVVPSVSEYRYAKTKDEHTEKARLGRNSGARMSASVRA